MKTSSFRRISFLTFVIFFISVTTFFAQLKKISNPNVYTEGNFFTDGSKLYTDAVVLKFKSKVINLTNGKNKAGKEKINQKFTLITNTFHKFEKKFGKVEFIKQIPSAEWGDTIKTNKSANLSRFMTFPSFLRLDFLHPFPLIPHLMSLRIFPKLNLQNNHFLLCVYLSQMIPIL